MKKIITILTVLFVILVLSSCSYEIVKKTDNRNTEQPTNQAAELSAKDILDLQSKCSSSSKALFSTLGYDGTNSDFTNHYNSKLTKCFILIGSTSIPDNYTYKELRDVYENKTIGRIQEVLMKKKQEDWKPYDCEMLDKFCESSVDFDNFVKPYMEE
jgi:hypothetical protein